MTDYLREYERGMVAEIDSAAEAFTPEGHTKGYVRPSDTTQTSTAAAKRKIGALAR